MKYKTTAKAIREGYFKIISIGYCRAQNLLAPFSPVAYTCGIYGWNFDLYEFNGVAICTGYRGMPKGGDYDYKQLKFFEKKAEEIRCSKAPYEEQKKKIRELLRDFLGGVKF